MEIPDELAAAGEIHSRIRLDCCKGEGSTDGGAIAGDLLHCWGSTPAANGEKLG
uniref:Uncharacterized protein n=1 Tax=Arundo donax TaxID=35708 RepID=A0A0A9HU58_ARUDO